MRRALPYALLLTFTFGVIEGLSYTAGRILQHRQLMYREPVRGTGHAVASFAEYLDKRDELIGWPYPAEFGGERFDASGSRPIPAFIDPSSHRSCVSLYGNSFTYGGEVDHEHAWGNQLSRLLGCRVANYGQGGYGSDQAYLRFKRAENDSARIVILSHLSENILRNLLRTRDSLTETMWYALKPRFILDANGQIELMPIPTVSEGEYEQILGIRSPQLFLEHQNFYVGGPAGLTRLSFPFTLSVLLNLRDFRMRAVLARRPTHAEFYALDHPFRGAQITAGILGSFYSEATARGQHPVIMIFATKGDLDFYRRYGRWTYESLLTLLREQDLPYLNFGDHLASRFEGRDLAEIFKPKGHYNEELNREVAEFVHRHLEESGLLSVIRGRQRD
jgi:hypothetical protein